MSLGVRVCLRACRLPFKSICVMGGGCDSGQHAGSPSCKPVAGACYHLPLITGIGTLRVCKKKQKKLNS